MKKDLTRYAMTILLACSLLLSGCGSIPIPGTGFGDNLPTDSRQSGEEWARSAKSPLTGSKAMFLYPRSRSQSGDGM